LDTDRLKQKPGFFIRLTLRLIKISLHPISWLPPKALNFLGGLAGGLFFRILKRRRVISISNMERAKDALFLPQDLDPAVTAKESFKTVAKTILESLAFQGRGMAYFKGRYSFQREEILTETLQQAKTRGTGLILLTAHMGNWELLPQAIRENFGLKIVTIGRTQGSVLVDSLIIETRTQTGNGFIFKDSGARDMLRVLKGGGVIGTLIDQAAIVEREGAILSFMGRKAHTNLGPVKLSAKTGAALVAVFARREGLNHVFEFQKAITPLIHPEGDWVLQAAQSLNDSLGAFIQRYPGQWMWGHRRWKTPEGIREDPDFF
jgi:KDO2-lipid IV(A) lauroyltransferase